MNIDNPEYAIEVNHLTKEFGEFTAVNDVSFNVRKGEIFGFLGANGAGKTTVLRMLIGLLRATKGDILINGIDIRYHVEEIKKTIGYMSQKFSLYNDLTAIENMRFFGGVYGLSGKEIRERSDELFDQFKLQPLRKKIVGSLPIGWKQKLAFCTTMIHQPSIVFLDEPTSGVDPIIRRKFWEIIYELSNKLITILVTTHNMDEAEYCHYTSIMVKGEIIALDSPLELKKQYNAQNMNEVFLQLATT